MPPFSACRGTPDLLSPDVTGVSYCDQGRSAFIFRQRPVIAQVPLVDAINRATPRTPTALLETMEDCQVTLERETMHWPSAHLILATYHPVALEGAFPLPTEAQLDCLLLRVRAGYSSEDEEEAILHRLKNDESFESLQSGVSVEQVLMLQRVIRQVQRQPEMERSLPAIMRATRSHWLCCKKSCRGSTGMA